MPPGSAPMIAQENSGWHPGVAHREMSVVEGVDPRTTGLARRERGVAWGVENPRTTGGDVRHGLEDLESDSHHLKGSRCSNWALRTLGLGYLKFRSKLPDHVSTLGIELRLLPGLIARPSGINQPNSLLEILVSNLLRSSPGDGGMAEIVTPDGPMAVQLVDGGHVARTVGLGLRILLRYALSDLPWGSACRGPARETTANSIFGTFTRRFLTPHFEDHQISKTGRTDTN